MKIGFRLAVSVVGGKLTAEVHVFEEVRMDGDFADCEGIVGDPAGTLFCRVGPFRQPLVCVAVGRVQLTFGKEFQVAVLCMRTSRCQF